jgi:D-3-phosphoglycerate dehydrogenase
VRKGLWQREANRGLEIKGRTVGIIGFGNMGSAFAQRLQGFECRIMAYDKYKPAGFAPSYVEEVSLAHLQEHADVLSLHVPLTPETHHMVNSHFISNFSHPFYLINTSRGAVLSTPDLAEAIEQQKIAGAALDVIEYEDMTRDGLDMEHLPNDFRYLLNSPRTVLTPHVAGWTVESKEKLAKVLALKIIDVLSQ